VSQAAALAAPRSREGSYSRLFSGAFKHSRNAMVLLDGARRHVDFNGAYLKTLGHPRARLLGHPIYEFVSGGPIASDAEWRAALASGDFNGEAELVHADGTIVAVQFAATVEVVTGRQLVLFVALNTSRWGRRFRRLEPAEQTREQLSPREREIVGLIALGRTSPEIAEELRIAHDTVRTHARNAMVKVGARSRAHLVARVLGEGLMFD
jgi:PAS domain S-box-containing protein